MTELHWFVLACHLLAGTIASWHALLYKREPRAAWGWIAVCLMFPLLGALLYVLFGVNRVRTRGSKLSQRSPFALDQALPPDDPATVGSVPLEYAVQARTAFSITGRPLLGGNHLDVLHNGEETYPAMLQAIDQAQEKVYIVTYIFEANETGKRFAKALRNAQDRGVDVRVLIDGIGEWSAWPLGGRMLQDMGVKVARFLPPHLLPPQLSINLRCHHKIMVVDGVVGFSGGMNIGDRYLAGNDNPHRVQDIHFRLRGPVVAQMEEIFLWDWGFATGQDTEPPSKMSPPCGDMACRTIADGPNEAHDKLPAIVTAAFNSAREHVAVMSPYFLPPREIIGAMQSAAQRGVQVQIILPAKSDHPMVDNATRNMLWELLMHEVRIHFQPPPFAHTKLLLVDGHYSLVGSANMDPRSLRLNFEFVIEVYHKQFCKALYEHFNKVLAVSRETSLEEVDNRKLWPHTRDAVCWLFSPYL